ncbi:CHAP domain-containing protein [Nocardia sp. 2YAB30]|uniref:CHAP domain-containing protein n=1 Tax=unclassified Nocardia TaxID=2637762 RepID=UPI003F990979
MATTRDELIGFVEDLYIPKIASGGLTSVIRAAQEAMEASILLFASGEGSEQPDLVGWMDKRNLLSDDGLDEPPGKSVMAESYSSRQSEVDAKKEEMDRQSHKVKDSSFKTFSLSNETYMSIKERVGKLDNDLRDINQRKDEEGAYLPLTAAEEIRALRYVLQAVDDVHDAVEGASDQIQNQAAGIHDSRPSFSSAPRANGSFAPSTLSTPWTASNASYDPTGNGTVDDILNNARRELGLNVHESGRNNVAGYYDEKGNLVGTADYNINGPWCASFATWVWEKAGYKVHWTYPDGVAAIWNDAYKMGLRRTNVSEAQPGDMIIFDWERDGTPDHIGIVESVNGNSITTIEGNSSDAVRRNNYRMGDPRLTGAVRPPTETQTQNVAV